MFPAPIPFISDFSVLDFEIWVLVLVRVSILVFLLPVIGSSTVSTVVKTGLAVLLSFIVFNTLPEFTLVMPDSVVGFFLLALKECMVGLVMGFSSIVLFLALQFAGRIIDFQSGFAMAQSVNPMTEASESVISQMQVALFSMLILFTHGHLIYIQVITESFQMIPPTMAQFQFNMLVPLVLSMVYQSLVMGIKLASPLLLPLLLTTAGLAIIARVMPQINVWLVGMPLKIAIGIVTLIFALPMLWVVFQKHMEVLVIHIHAMMKVMGGATLGI